MSYAQKPADSPPAEPTDKTHNARAIVVDLSEHGEVGWDWFTGGKACWLWSYRALADAFETLFHGAGAMRLSATVGMMEELGNL